MAIIMAPTLWKPANGPTFVAAGTASTNTGAQAVALPVGWAQNDILVIVNTPGDTLTAVAAPTGYTTMTGSPVAAAAIAVNVYWKRATASESAPTVADGGNQNSAFMFAIRGCATTGDPFVATAGVAYNSSTTAVSASTLTTTRYNSLVVQMIATNADSASNQIAGATNAALAGFAIGQQFSTSGNSGGGVAMLYGTKYMPGTTANTSLTLAAAQDIAVLTAEFYTGAY